MHWPVRLEGKAARVVLSYYTTRFSRFLVSLRQDHSRHDRKVYYLRADSRRGTEPWTDDDLYAKYGLTRERDRASSSPMVTAR